MPITHNGNAEDSCLKNHNNTTLQHDPDHERDIAKTVQPVIGESDNTHRPSSGSDSPTLNDDEQYPEGGLQGWLVTFGSFCGMFTVFGLINSSGVFEAYFKANQLAGHSDSQIGWIFSLYLFLVFFIGIQVGPIFDQYGTRVLVAVGSIFCVASLMLLSISKGMSPTQTSRPHPRPHMLTSGVSEYYQIILTYSVVGGIGGALLNCPSYGAIAHFFNVRRGLATGIASTAGGLGGVMFPLLLQYLLGPDGIGFGWSCRTLGFILLALCAFANLFIRARLSTPYNPDGTRKSKSVWPDFTIFKHKGFAMATVGIFFMEWGLFIPLTYVVSYAKAHGQTEQDGSILLAVLNAGSVVGRFLPGLLSDKLGRFNIIICTITLCIITVLGLWLPAHDSKGLLIAFCVVFGFASGSNLGLYPVCIGQFCNSKDYGRYFTAATLVGSFGTLSSVPIGGALLDMGGRDGWVGLILFSGLSYVVSVTCYIGARIHATGWKLFAKF